MTLFSWTGRSKDGDLGTAANWSPGGGPPGAGDTAAFGAVGGAVSGDAAVGVFRFDQAVAVSFSGTLAAGGLDGVAATSLDAGASVAFDPGASLTVGGKLDVGVSSGASTLSLNTAFLTSGSAVIGDGRDASGEVVLYRESWNNAGRLVIGGHGSGGVVVEGGASLTVGSMRHAGSIVLGVHAGASGSLAVSGSSVRVYGDIDVGGVPGAAHHGDGAISVAPSGAVTATGTISVADGSSISLDMGSLQGGDIVVAAGGSISAFGNVTAVGGIVNDGLLVARTSLVVHGPISGSGTISIGGFLMLDEPVSQASIVFEEMDGTLALGEFFSLTAPIAGFAGRDEIVVDHASAVRFDVKTDVLTLFDGKQVAGRLQLTGGYAGAVFHDSYVDAVGTITVSTGG